MTKKREVSFVFKGTDEDLNTVNLSEIDGTLALSPEKKLQLICELVTFNYQLKNKTNDIPRLLRTTACIRKA